MTGQDQTDDRRVACVWENLGPGHFDRLRALAGAGWDPVAIQLFAKSSTYDWEGGDWDRPVITIDNGRGTGSFALGWRLFRAIGSSGARIAMLCHYNLLAVFLAAVLLRVTGVRCIAMVDSKFDDYPRRLPRAWASALLLVPYHGVITASLRSRDWLHFLGFAPGRIALGYDTLDLARLRRQASAAAPSRFEDRPFLIVARLVPKKNVTAALSAYAVLHGTGERRGLKIIGDGPMRAELEAEAVRLGVGDAVDFEGWVPSERVSEAMAGALCLVLSSIEEQFGFVVLEAMAVGLPVIAASQAGAVDILVDNLVNGYVVDARNEAQLIAAMRAMGEDEARHARFAAAARDAAERCDATAFAAGLAALSGARDALPSHRTPPVSTAGR